MSPHDLANFRADDVLQGLHGFQRDAVEYAFHRLYEAPDSSRRFLIADEVGLGKTLIARGVIAKAIEHLKSRVARVDVLYICSNLAIARQNRNRLTPTPDLRFSDAERVTLLPLTMHLSEQRPVNLVALTPGTSLDLKSSLGIARERILLYALLKDHWGLKGVAPQHVFQGNVMDSDRFQDDVRTFLRAEASSISPELRAAFYKALDAQPELRDAFGQVCELFSRKAAHRSDEARDQRNTVVGQLRSLLAASCIGFLEPDLVILDEFQRFKSLLARDSEEGMLAQQLFEWSSDHAAARVLLLSATPYKGYTSQLDTDDEDHFEDFIATVDFLNADASRTTALRTKLSAYRRTLFEIRPGQSPTAAIELKDSIQADLRRVMSRTERLRVAGIANGMLSSHVTPIATTPDDLRAYVALSKLAETLQTDDCLEYWKSAPFPLSFMEGYLLRRALPSRSGPIPAETARALAAAAEFGFPMERSSRYDEIAPTNAKARALIASLSGSGAFDRLWLPPALPYYGQLSEAERRLTKTLIFSSWQLVPKSIASVVSYEAERRAIRLDEPAAVNTPEARKGRRALLRFSRSDSRLSGLPNLSLLYPCAALAAACDPLRLPTGASQEEALAWAEARVRELLPEGIAFAEPNQAADERWYWAGGPLLDLERDPALRDDWWDIAELDGVWALAEDAEDGEDAQDSAWSDHVFAARTFVLREGLSALGKAPSDLVRVMAATGLSSPACAALRALSRMAPDTDPERGTTVRIAAAQVAWGFRSLLNRPESIGLVRRGRSETPYWKLALEYCFEHHLSAVLDEYVHVLRDARGLTRRTEREVATEIARAVVDVLQIRAASLDAETFEVDLAARSVVIGRRGLRSHFAMRFGSDKTDDEKHLRRSQIVGDAFNSPFWPFVLATTSIGQEGLDFHWYCHAVVHWNLPTNPVDLEQREGRVHRFKGHAVRKNVARDHAVATRPQDGADPWEAMFEAAGDSSADRGNGLVPYWLYSTPGGHTIERHVPVYGLSKEEQAYGALRRALGAYRIVFGQPRQDELLEFLLRQTEETELTGLSEHLAIDLAPLCKSGEVSIRTLRYDDALQLASPSG